MPTIKNTIKYMRTCKYNGIIKNLLFALAAAVLIIALWWGSSLLTGNPKIWPSPKQTAASALKILQTKDFYVRLYSTLLRTGIAFAASFAAALLLSLISMKIAVRRVLSPLITVIRALPTLALVLIFMVWMRDALKAIPIAITMLVMLPTLFSTYNSALDGVPRELIETAKVFGAGKVKTAAFVYLPHITPTVIESCAGGISLSPKLVVSAEILAHTADSVGVMMQQKQIALDMVGLIAIAAMIALLCVALEFIIRLPLRKLKR